LDKKYEPIGGAPTAPHPPLNTNNNIDNERFVRAMYAEALTAVRMQTELTGV